MPDYYKILGVDKDAGFDEIRIAYRIKAKLYHPDLNKGANAKIMFQQLNEAYHILADKDKRSFYDNRLNFDIALYRKYGKNYGNRQTGNNTASSYYASYSGSSFSGEDDSVIFNKIKKNIDGILFYIMLAIGITTIIFGIKDLFFKKWQGEKNLIGIFFGLSFTGILIYGWSLRAKFKNLKK